MKNKISAYHQDQRVRYVISGGASYLIEFTFFIITMALSNMLFLSNSLSFACGFIISFYLHKKWSFKGGEHKHKTHTQLSGYAVLAAVNLALTNVLIGIITHSWHVKPAVAKLLVMLCIVIWNYVIMSRLLFKKGDSLEI